MRTNYKRKATSSLYKKPKMSLPSGIRNYVHQAIKQASEKKRLISQATESTLATSTIVHVFELSQLEQGDDSFQRIADKVSPSSVKLDYLLHNNAAAPVGVRVVMIKANPGEYIDATGLIRVATSGDAVVMQAENIRDLMNPLNEGSFTVIYDQLHLIPGLGDATTLEAVKGSVNRALSGTRYFEADTAQDSKGKDNIRVFFICRHLDNDSTAGAVELTFSSEYWYRE